MRCLLFAALFCPTLCFVPPPPSVKQSSLLRGGAKQRCGGSPGKKRVRPCGGEGQARLKAQQWNDLMATVYRKQQEVDRLSSTLDDVDNMDVKMRLEYVAEESSYRLRRALRRSTDLADAHQLAVVADIKRRSPTAKQLPREVVSFQDPGRVGKSLVRAGADALFVNTDFSSYGGSMEDLDDVVKAVGRTDAPPVVMKDIILHPMQIALAAEHGASGVVLLACVLGPLLEDIMSVCTTVGIESIVEVHTPTECEKVLEYGCQCIMVNNWDRITGQLHEKQAKSLRRLIPNEVVTLAGGGLESASQCKELADVGYDAVVFGRSLCTASNPSTLIREVRERQGVPRNLLGLGLAAEDLL